MGSSFGSLGDKHSYSVSYDEETRDTIVTVRIFDVYKKKDIMRNLRDFLKDLNKTWRQKCS